MMKKIDFISDEIMTRFDYDKRRFGYDCFGMIKEFCHQKKQYSENYNYGLVRQYW